MAPLKIKTFTMRKIVTAFFMCFILSGAIVYTLFQARLLIEGPQILVTNEPQTVQYTRTLVIQGNALNIVSLFLNGRPIVTDETGKFSETIVLENGYTVVRLDATDRYGRSVFVERSFVYQGNPLAQEWKDAQIKEMN
jgi:hypothetical protein